MNISWISIYLSWSINLWYKIFILLLYIQEKFLYWWFSNWDIVRDLKELKYNNDFKYWELKIWVNKREWLIII